MSEPPASDSLRAFVALDLPEAAKDTLARAQAALKETGAEVKWVAPQNLHVTLHFLGDVPKEQLDGLTTAVETACESREPFPLAVSHLSAFPNPRRPKVVTAAFSGDLTALLGLADAVARALKPLGYPADKPFKPHVTLGRSRSDKPDSRLTDALRQAAPSLPSSFTADTVTFYQSELRPIGPIYTPIARWSLQLQGNSGLETNL